MIRIAFLALGRMMFKESTYTGNGQHPELMKMITDIGLKKKKKRPNSP